jgi:hypothetical protein
MADMGGFEDLHHPEIGLLCVHGHYTMDMKRAAYAARRFFNFRTVIPLPLPHLPAARPVGGGAEGGPAQR